MKTTMQHGSMHQKYSFINYINHFIMRPVLSKKHTGEFLWKTCPPTKLYRVQELIIQ